MVSSPDPEPLEVLVVEDDRAFQDIIDVMLQRSEAGRLDGRIVGTLDGAVAALAERPCDVIVLDLNLPDSQGLASLELLHSRAPHAPIVVLTGGLHEAGVEDDGLVALAAGAHDYIPKSHLDADRLCRSIRYAYARTDAREAEADAWRAAQQRLDRLDGEDDVQAYVRSAIEQAALAVGAPLTPLRAHLKALGAAPRPPPQGVWRALGRLDEAVTSLIRHAHGQPAMAPRRADAPVAAMLASIDEDYAPVARANSVILHVDTSFDGAVLADPDQAEIVLGHLVELAIRHTPAGGYIDVMCRSGQRDATFFVRDTGPGIDPRTQRDMFEAGRNGRRAGLYACKQIITANGGSIDCLSHGPEQGTTILFTLPLAGDQASNAAISPRRTT